MALRGDGPIGHLSEAPGIDPGRRRGYSRRGVAASGKR
jgi:hypothetical protein